MTANNCIQISRSSYLLLVCVVVVHTQNKRGLCRVSQPRQHGFCLEPSYQLYMSSSPSHSSTHSGDTQSRLENQNSIYRILKQKMGKSLFKKINY